MNMLCYTSVNNASTVGALANLCVTDAGNAYAQVRDYSGLQFLSNSDHTSGMERPRNIRSPLRGGGRHSSGEWFSVTDKRSVFGTPKTFDIKFLLPTYEGWMVLCDEGENECGFGWI